MSSAEEDEYEALIQFLYMAPIGLMQTRMDGEIVMINPLCAQLLMPLSPDGELANLFAALESAAPDLGHRARSFEPPRGMICNALHLQIDAGVPGRKDAQILSVSLLKLDSERLMAVLSDVTRSVKRDRELRQSRAWMNTIVTAIADYALLSVDSLGRAQCWNPSVSRITGFEAEATLGRSYAMFYPPDGMLEQRALDRLHEADRTGWSLDEGWHLRADGSRFWGSCLIAPLQQA